METEKSINLMENCGGKTVQRIISYNIGNEINQSGGNDQSIRIFSPMATEQVSSSETLQLSVTISFLMLIRYSINQSFAKDIRRKPITQVGRSTVSPTTSK